nr:ABC transporter permease subunit [Paenibacillus thalictri]
MNQVERAIAAPGAKSHVKVSFLRNVRKYWIFYIMMLPAIILLFINNYMPMFGVLIAFKNVNYQQGIWGSPWVGLTNFKFLFASNDAWVITRNTLLYNVVFIVFNLIFPVAFAIMFNELRNKLLAKFHQSVLFLPHFLSWVVVSFLLFAFLGQEHGLMNMKLLPALGLEPKEWYAKPEYWPYILPLVNLWKHMGYYTVIYLAAIVGIDRECYEAAYLDGASKWQQIRNITIPLLFPVIITMTLLQIGRIFYADFGLFFQATMNAGALYPTTSVIDTYVYNSFLVTGNIGMSSAAGLYQSVVGLLMVLGSNLIVRKISKENALF